MPRLAPAGQVYPPMHVLLPGFTQGHPRPPEEPPCCFGLWHWVCAALVRNRPSAKSHWYTARERAKSGTLPPLPLSISRGFIPGVHRCALLLLLGLLPVAAVTDPAHCTSPGCFPRCPQRLAESWHVCTHLGPSSEDRCPSCPSLVAALTSGQSF